MAANLKRCITATIIGVVTLGVVGCAKPVAQQAREELRARHDSNMAQLAAQQAEQDFRVGNLKQGLGNIEHAIIRAPDDPRYHVLRGRILIEQNRLEAALSSFRQAIEIDEKHAEAHYYAGLVHQRWSDYDSAHRSYAASLSVDPTNADYLLATVEMLVTMRQLDRATDLIAEHQNRFEHNAALRRARGHIAMLEDHPALAAEHFHKAMLLAPDDLSVVEMLALAHYRAGNFARAEHFLGILFRHPEYDGRDGHPPRRDLQHLRALCLTAQERLVEARTIYLRLVEQDPSDPRLWFELGTVAFRLGDLRRVRTVVGRTIATWPERFEGFVLRGMLHEQEGRLNEAIADYRRAARLEPRQEEPLLLLGMALEKAGRRAEAREVFAAAQLVNPHSEHAIRLGGVEP